MSRRLRGGIGGRAKVRNAAAERDLHETYTGPPATLGNTAAAGARLLVWCRACRHRVEPIQQQWLSVTAPTPPFALAQEVDLLALRRAGDRLRADGRAGVRVCARGGASSSASGRRRASFLL